MRPRDPKPGWVADHGELVRQHRLYTTLSLEDFAAKVGIAEASLRDIEKGRRDCPENVLDRIVGVTQEFDTAVQECVDEANDLIEDDESLYLTVRSTRNLDDAWERAVLGRAAVLDGTIVPILDGSIPAV